MENVTTLTSKGQVTIPKGIRDELGLRPHDKVRFFIEDGEARFQKAYPSLEEAAGSMPLPRNDITIEEAIGLAKEHRARALVAKLNSP